MKDFLGRLQERMAELGLSQAALARALRTHQSTVGRWFAGSTPRGRMADDLCVALHCAKGWLLEGRPPKEPRPTGEQAAQALVARGRRHALPLAHAEQHQAREELRREAPEVAARLGTPRPYLVPAEILADCGRIGRRLEEEGLRLRRLAAPLSPADLRDAVRALRPLLESLLDHAEVLTLSSR